MENQIKEKSCDMCFMYFMESLTPDVTEQNKCPTCKNEWPKIHHPLIGLMLKNHLYMTEKSKTL